MPFLAPIIAGVAGSLGAAAGTAALIGQVGSSLIGLGASYALTALFGGRDQGRGSRGLSQELTFGGDSPRTLVFGRLPIEGHAVDYMSSGGANMVEWEVRVLSDFECDGLEKIWVDGKERELVEKPTEGGEDKHYWVKPWDTGGGYLRVYFFRGRENHTTIPLQVTESNPSGHWTTDHRLRGMCFVAIRKYYDSEQFTQFPQFRFLVRGVKCYDWRLDSTAGGSGSHRWADRSTWAYTDNPAVILYNYMRGFWRGGVRIMGMGVQPADLNLALFTAAANECDELVTLKGGGTEKRYRMAFEHRDDQQHVGIIEACIAAMGGRMWERAGVYAPIPGGSRSVVRTLTDGDLVASAGVRFSRRRSRAELRNHVSGSYLSEAEDWNAAPYAPITNPDAEAADGNERLAEVLDLPMVFSKTQAQRIATIRYNEIRSQATASIVVGLRHIDLEAGDWVSWQSARYGTRTYVIARHRLQSDLTIALDLVETSAAVYGWNPIDEIDTPPPGTRPTPSPGATTVANFTIQSTLIGAANGQRIPAIRASWTPPNDTTIIAVIVEHRAIGDTDWAMARFTRPNDGSGIIRAVPGNTGYEARATIETRPARRVTYTDTAQITTQTTPPNIPPGIIDIGALDPILGGLLNGDGVGSLPWAQGQITAGQRRLDEIGRDLDNVVRPSDTTIRFDVEMLAQTLAALQSRFETLRTATIEAGLEINSVEGRARISAIAVLASDTARQFNSVALTLSSLDARISAIASVVIDGDLDGLIDQITTVGLELDALAASLSLYATKAELDAQVVRINTAEININANTAAIALRATQTVVDALTTRVNAAEIAISAQSGIILNVTAQLGLNDADIRDMTLAQILDLLSRQQNNQVEKFARATSGLNARIDETGAAVATQRTELIALNDETRAIVVTQGLALAAADQALASSLTALQATVNDPITGLLQTRADLLNEGTVRATRDAAAAENLLALRSTLSRRATVTISDTAPSAPAANDLWVRPALFNQVFRRVGSTWSYVTGGSAWLFQRQNAMPTAPLALHLWADQDDADRLYEWNGNFWTDLTTPVIAASATAIDSLQATVTQQGNDITSIASRVTGVESTLTVRARVWTQTTAPAGTAHNVNDLWFDTDDENRQYRWNGSAWVNVTTSTPPPIIQATAPTTTFVGQLWIRSTDNRLHRWNGSAWIDVTDTRTAANASAINTLTTSVSTINGQITALSSAQTATQAQLDDASANGRFRVVSVATAAGAVSSVEARVDATSGSATVRGAFRLDAINVGSVRHSRMVVNTDLFAFATGTTSTQVFTASASGVWIDAPLWVGGVNNTILIDGGSSGPRIIGYGP